MWQWGELAAFPALTSEGRKKMYTIDEKIFETAEKAAQYIIDNAGLADEYDEMLDDRYGEIHICGLTYAPSEALRRVDKVAYDCGYNDYLDSLYWDVLCEVEGMDDGDEVTSYGFEVVYTD